MSESSVDVYISQIMQGNFSTMQDTIYSKVFNDKFEIILKKKKPLLVIDKRTQPFSLYHDIKTAYNNVVMKS